MFECPENGEMDFGSDDQVSRDSVKTIIDKIKNEMAVVLSCGPKTYLQLEGRKGTLKDPDSLF